MLRHIKTTLSTIAAVGMLGCAVMLSVSSAEGPYHASDNAFNGPPLGHSDKALIQAQWLSQCDAEPATADRAAFDWGFPAEGCCPKCCFKDSKVTPVVVDVPELLGPSDVTAIEVIKRKLGINAFRGSIFEDPQFPAAQWLSCDAPPKLGISFCDAFSLINVGASSACGTSCNAIDMGKSTVTTATAATTSNEICSSHEACATAGACSTANAQCDKCSDSGLLTQACESRPASTVEASTVVSAPRGRAVSSSIEEDSVAALRRASLDLDEAAMRLEVSDRYSEADALREAAQHLRMKARDLKRPATGAVTATATEFHDAVTRYRTGITDYPGTNAQEDQPKAFKFSVGISR
jgi:hypothetical protein